MAGVSGEGTLLLPVRLHGIQLGRPVDLIVDPPSGRAVGFDVLCGDDVHRFLPIAAAQVGEQEIAVGSSLMLLEDVGFYRKRGESLRALRGRPVRRGRRALGVLVDLTLSREGKLLEIVLERDGRQLRTAFDPSLDLHDGSSASAA
jgi:hypothetical protein